MMRALWNGASGMIAQQTSLDTISNNMANVNTTGFKKETVEFQSLLYQKLQRQVTDNNGDPKPVIGQVGLGVRTSSIVSQYTQGTLLETSNTFDMAIEGDGFFMVRTADGSTAYTRNGSFGLAIAAEGITLANAEGYELLNTAGEPIIFNTSWDPTNVSVNEFGELLYLGDDNVNMQTGVMIGLAQFNNPAGLEKMSGSLLRATDNSGEARLESEDTALKKSKIFAGYLEGSNVQVANEIVDLIVTQRAYEMNSKSITAADEMLQQANNLRG